MHDFRPFFVIAFDTVFFIPTIADRADDFTSGHTRNKNPEWHARCKRLRLPKDSLFVNC